MMGRKRVKGNGYTSKSCPPGGVYPVPIYEDVPPVHHRIRRFPKIGENDPETLANAICAHQDTAREIQDTNACQNRLTAYMTHLKQRASHLRFLIGTLRKEKLQQDANTKLDDPDGIMYLGYKLLRDIAKNDLEFDPSENVVLDAMREYLREKGKWV